MGPDFNRLDRFEQPRAEFARENHLRMLQESETSRELSEVQRKTLVKSKALQSLTKPLGRGLGAVGRALVKWGSRLEANYQEITLVSNSSKSQPC